MTYLFFIFVIVLFVWLGLRERALRKEIVEMLDKREAELKEQLRDRELHAKMVLNSIMGLAKGDKNDSK